MQAPFGSLSARSVLTDSPQAPETSPCLQLALHVAYYKPSDVGKGQRTGLGLIQSSGLSLSPELCAPGHCVVAFLVIAIVCFHPAFHPLGLPQRIIQASARILSLQIMIIIMTQSISW